MDARLIAPGTRCEDVEVILATRDAETLDRWIERAATCATVAELFA